VHCCSIHGQNSNVRLHASVSSRCRPPHVDRSMLTMSSSMPFSSSGVRTVLYFPRLLPQKQVTSFPVTPTNVIFCMELGKRETRPGHPNATCYNLITVGTASHDGIQTTLPKCIRKAMFSAQ
jgi:hypothetical protein